MCIALFSTEHPDYSLIVINNRDEYLHRPTALATWWPSPDTNVLGGQDLARATHGTWMGVTKEGKVAVLTNYRETTSDQATGARSRGVIVNSWLCTSSNPPASTLDFVQGMVASPDARNVGGFSLVCGYVDEPLAIVSNRSATMDQIAWIAGDENEGREQTLGLSNTTFEDRSWPKIVDGERLTRETIEGHVKAGSQEDEDALIERFLRVLSKNDLPELAPDATAEDYLPHFRKSIFIPLIGTKDQAQETATQTQTPQRVGGDGIDHSYLHGAYGTQKQTVVLVRKDGRVRYFERTLYDGDVRAIPPGQGDRSFEFTVSR